MIKAIYKLREDGDYDFVAAFNKEQCPPPFPDGTDWCEEIKEWLEFSGETARIFDNLDITQVVDVWPGDAA